jgi:hypothetical protein
VRGGLDWWKYDHAEPTRAVIDLRTTSGTVGVDYVTPAFNSIGAQFKYTEGSYANLQPVGALLVDNSFREYEASAVAHWIVTGKSVLDGRIGYTKREHKQLPQRDFDGLTGRLSYDWFVASKTVLNFAVWRETLGYTDVTASYVVSKGASFGPSWAPTAQLVFQGRLVHEKRDFSGAPGLVLGIGPQSKDTFNGVRLSAGWTPRRFIELVVAADKGERSSNTVGRDYDYTAVMANAKLRF